VTGWTWAVNRSVARGTPYRSLTVIPEESVYAANSSSGSPTRSTGLRANGWDATFTTPPLRDTSSSSPGSTITVSRSNSPRGSSIRTMTGGLSPSAERVDLKALRYAATGTPARGSFCTQNGASVGSVTISDPAGRNSRETRRRPPGMG